MALLKRGLDFPSGSNGLYGTTKAFMLDGNYAQIGNTDIADSGNCALVTDPDGVSGGVVFRCNQNSYGGGGNRITMRKVLPAPKVTLFCSTRMWMESLPSSSTQIPLPIVFKSSGNDSIVELRVLTTGAIDVYGNGSTRLGGTTGPVLSANGWHHIECQLTCSTSGSGEVYIWIEGEEVLHLTGLTTQANSVNVGSISQIERGVDPSATSTNPAVYFKDTVENDSSGSYNNGQIGPKVVAAIVPNADVSSGWTSTGANDWSVLDEAPPNDADYIEAGDPPPAPSIVEFTNLPSDIVSVYGLVHYHRSQKTDSGDGSIQASLSPNGTDWADGGDDVQTIAMLYYSDVSEVSPDGGAPWVVSEVNSLQAKYNRTL